MGISAAVFESASKRSEHLIPGTYSRSNNVSSSGGISFGNVVILGNSTGGKPNTLLKFSTLAEAKDVLVSGELLNGVAHAFTPSNSYRPGSVFAMRVNEGTQAECILKNGGTDVLKLKSWDYGVHTNQLKILVDDGSDEGTKKVSVVFRDSKIEYDNILKNSFSMVYTGEGTEPRITITPTSLTAVAKTIPEGEEEPQEIDKVEISFNDFETIESLVARINDTETYVATLIDSDVNSRTKDLDSVSGVDITNDVVFTSTLKLLMDKLLSCAYIGDVELLSESRILPESGYVYQYFTGGTAGTSNVSDWIKTLGLLEKENIQIIATTSTNKSVQNLIASHCVEMSATENRMERTCFIGGELGISDDEACTIAKGYNSKYVSFVADGIDAVNPLTGVVEKLSGSYLACKLAGLEASLAVSEPLTNKDVNVLGFYVTRKKSSIEKLIANGVLCVNVTQDNRFAVIRAVTTYQSDDLMSCERSMVREDLYMNCDLRNRFAGSIGSVGDIGEDEITSVLKGAAKEWARANCIIPKGADNVWDISVRVDGDKVYLTYSRYLAAPRNFVFITANNYTYSTTVLL